MCNGQTDGRTPALTCARNVIHSPESRHTARSCSNNTVGQIVTLNPRFQYMPAAAAISISASGACSCTASETQSHCHSQWTQPQPTNRLAAGLNNFCRQLSDNHCCWSVAVGRRQMKLSEFTRYFAVGDLIGISENV